jgi:hypothetical protein
MISTYTCLVKSQIRRYELKKAILGILASVMALAMLLPLTAVATAQPEVTTDTVPELRPALAIKAPELAGVGQWVTIKVIEKHTGKPVPRAGVWAVDVRDIETETNDAEAYASLAEKCGHFLGWTDRNGNVFHRFREPGRYVLVAVKDGFVPGFAQIEIKPLKALAIKAPDVAGVGQLVTITVYERYIGVLVPRAGVWAVDVQRVENGDNDAKAYAALAEKCGHFLGWTDKHGNVFHRFKEPGRYLLVAVKDGLIPGFARITILSLQPVTVQPMAVVDATRP